MLDRRMQDNEQAGYLSKIISQIRMDHPTLSYRAMYYKVNPDGMGRDAFEQLCSSLGLYTTKPVNRHRTTNSSGVIRFENLLSELTLTATDQAWSSDITYFEINDQYYYITFILDCFSRRILGHVASKRLTTEETTLPALRQAIATRGGKVADNIIFHSDGGGQYYDKEFLEYTSRHRFRNSMCEYAYENGKAERINGIIKNNYLRHYHIRTFADLLTHVDRAVSLYNTERPHKALVTIQSDFTA
jgi:transposase InsO family protein